MTYSTTIGARSTASKPKVKALSILHHSISRELATQTMWPKQQRTFAPILAAVGAGLFAVRAEQQIASVELLYQAYAPFGLRDMQAHAISIELVDALLSAGEVAR